MRIIHDALTDLVHESIWRSAFDCGVDGGSGCGSLLDIDERDMTILRVAGADDVCVFTCPVCRAVNHVSSARVPGFVRARLRSERQ